MDNAHQRDELERRQQDDRRDEERQRNVVRLFGGRADWKAVRDRCRDHQEREQLQGRGWRWLPGCERCLSQRETADRGNVDLCGAWKFAEAHA